MRATLKKRIRKLDSQTRLRDTQQIPPELKAKMREAWERGDTREWSRLMWDWLEATKPKEVLEQMRRNIMIIYGKGANYDRDTH